MTGFLRQSIPFESFFLGGFECSTHYRHPGHRLDLIDSTRHDQYAEADYARLLSRGIRACRDGVRWHLIERYPRHYDFASLYPMVRAARRTGMRVVWDVCHYGWPDSIDIFQPEFVRRFASFARATARFISQETDGDMWFTPVNEISFFSWAGGETGIISPFVRGRGHELKCQLVRATIEGIEAIRDVIPHARFVQVDPLIHIIANPDDPPALAAEARGYRDAQFQGWDMVAGRLHPELGGHPRYLDVIGANYYVHNQWVYGGRFVERTDPRYRPFNLLLRELWERYRKPLFIAETGIEDDRRPEWLRYVCDEVVTALWDEIPVGGICLYPVVNHPGWADDRHCHNGLWDYCNDLGDREIYIPLEKELRRQQHRIQQVLTAIRKSAGALEVVA